MQVDARANRGGPIRPTSNIYLMSWVALAAFGLGYIGLAATRPDLLGSVLPLADPPGEQIVAGRSAGDIADELSTLRKWVHDLQHELAATKSTLQEQTAQNSALIQRVAAAEDRLGPVREVRAEQTGRATVQRLQGRTPGPAAAAAEAPQRPAQQQAAAAPEPPAALPGMKVINNTSPITTGSVPDGNAVTNPPAAKSAAAPPQPRQSPRAVEIGSSDSLEGLRAKWGDLTGRNPELGSLAPRYKLTADGRQAPFTLLAGPFESPDAATRTCDALRAKGVTCRVGSYTGNAF